MADNVHFKRADNVEGTKMSMRELTRNTFAAFMPIYGFYSTQSLIDGVHF